MPKLFFQTMSDDPNTPNLVYTGRARDTLMQKNIVKPPLNKSKCFLIPPINLTNIRNSVCPSIICHFTNFGRTVETLVVAHFPSLYWFSFWKENNASQNITASSTSILSLSSGAHSGHSWPVWFYCQIILIRNPKKKCPDLSFSLHLFFSTTEG